MYKDLPCVFLAILLSLTHAIEAARPLQYGAVEDFFEGRVWDHLGPRKGPHTRHPLLSFSYSQ